MIGFDKYNGEKFERPNMNNEEKDRRNYEMKFDTPEEFLEYLKMFKEKMFKEIDDSYVEIKKEEDRKAYEDGEKFITYVLGLLEKYDGMEENEIQTYIEGHVVTLLEVNKRIRNNGLEETKKSLMKEKSHLEEWLRKYKEEHSRNNHECK